MSTADPEALSQARSEAVVDSDSLSCPVPRSGHDTIQMGHGSGGRMSAELLSGTFLAAFTSAELAALGDAAVVDTPGGRLAFTTDAYVVTPRFFPGGDIGRLAVSGTINDLAMMGAKPLYLAAAFILEEGLPIEDLRRIVASAAATCKEAGVPLVAGDTKVVDRGSGDGVYITTSGVGIVPAGIEIGPDRARPGDVVIVSGAIGDHGIAVMSVREGIEFSGDLASDAAPLHILVAGLLEAAPGVRCLRDPTRGGLASTVNELAGASKVCIELDEAAIPVHAPVRGACELLGLDPMYVANEGKLVAIVDSSEAGAALEALRSNPLGREAAVIGRVTQGPAGMVSLRTAAGSSRIVDLLAGEQLPRIC